jgi:hypothetical protein
MTFISLVALFSVVLADDFVVKTLWLQHQLKGDKPPFSSLPDPSCSITMRVSWTPTTPYPACIARENDDTFNVSVPLLAQAVVDLRAVDDVPSQPSVDVALDCFENDCDPKCEFDAQCGFGQEDDVREQQSATFLFEPNQTVTVAFALKNFVLGLSLEWAQSPRAAVPGSPPPAETALLTPARSPAATFGPQAPSESPSSSTSASASPSSPGLLPIAIGVAAAVVVVLLASIGIAVFCKRKSRASERSHDASEDASQIAFQPIAAPASKTDTLVAWEADAGAKTVTSRASAPALTVYDAVPQIDDE